jgi:hypothetical protein
MFLYRRLLQPIVRLWISLFGLDVSLFLRRLMHSAAASGHRK